MFYFYTFIYLLKSCFKSEFPSSGTVQYIDTAAQQLQLIECVLYFFKVRCRPNWCPKQDFIEKKWTWWPILCNRALHLTNPKCTHTHTPWIHTWSSRQPFMLRCLGRSCGFGALLKGTSVVVLRVERTLDIQRAQDIHSPHLQFLPAWDSNSQPFDFESNSLTNRPRLPHCCFFFSRVASLFLYNAF